MSHRVKSYSSLRLEARSDDSPVWRTLPRAHFENSHKSARYLFSYGPSAAACAAATSINPVSSSELSTL